MQRTSTDRQAVFRLVSSAMDDPMDDYLIFKSPRFQGSPTGTTVFPDSPQLSINGTMLKLSAILPAKPAIQQHLQPAQTATAFPTAGHDNCNGSPITLAAVPPIPPSAALQCPCGQRRNARPGASCLPPPPSGSQTRCFAGPLTAITASSPPPRSADESAPILGLSRAAAVSWASAT